MKTISVLMFFFVFSFSTTALSFGKTTMNIEKITKGSISVVCYESGEIIVNEQAKSVQKKLIDGNNFTNFSTIIQTHGNRTLVVDGNATCVTSIIKS